MLRSCVLGLIKDHKRVTQGPPSHIRKGRDLNRLKIVSPFGARLSYNVYSAFRVLAAHERRHVWQAERAAGA